MFYEAIQKIKVARFMDQCVWAYRDKQGFGCGYFQRHHTEPGSSIVGQKSRWGRKLQFSHREDYSCSKFQFFPLKNFLEM